MEIPSNPTFAPVFSALLAAGLWAAPASLAGVHAAEQTPSAPLPSAVAADGALPYTASRAVTAPPAARRVALSLKDMGQTGQMNLRGVEGLGDVGFGLRRDEMVESARLRLNYTLSPALLPHLSHLKVLFNGELQQTLALDKGKLGSAQTAEFDIDTRLFTDYNRLQFQFIGHYTLECEMPSHTSLWATIANDSRLDLSLRQLPLRNDLALLPLPFFDPQDARPLNVPMVFGGAPSLGLLKASGSIAGWLGVMASYRGHRFPVLDNQLPSRHGVVLATNDNRPVFLKELPPVDAPTLLMVSNPEVTGGKLLLVLGKDDAQVQIAADTLVLGKASLSGQRIQVKALDYPPLRKAYDAPRWVNSEQPVKLGDLATNPTDLQVSGSVLNHSVSLQARLAPDLYTWSTRGIPLKLMYRYTPNGVSEHGAMGVSVNDVFIRSFPLSPSDVTPSSTASLLMPLLGEGQNRAKAELNVPAFYPGDNRLKVTFQIPQPDMGKCSSIQPTQLSAAIDADSHLDLTGYRHHITMPNLAVFGSSGFPFSKFADLSQTAVVMPPQPTLTEAEAYLTALGRLGASTGYPGTRFKLLPSTEMAQAKGLDVLLISEGDRDGSLAQWGQQLPALLEAGKRSVQPLSNPLTQWVKFFRFDDVEPIDPPSGGFTTLQGDGPLAAVVGLKSPLGDGRSMVALTATGAGAMQMLSQRLGDVGQSYAFRGDLALMRSADQIENFRVHAPYYLGNLPWWQHLWFVLQGQPALVALVGIVMGLMLTFLVYGALRAMAARRLGGGKSHG
jgi:cellulose synthase operon protein B